MRHRPPGREILAHLPTQWAKGEMARGAVFFKGGWLAESTLIPVSCFRYAGEQAKSLKVGEKITVIARLRGSKFTTESGTEKHGIQLAERVFEHSIRDPFDVSKHALEPPLEIEE